MKKLSAFIILISLSVFFIFSCQKDKTYEAGESNNLRTTVTGIVLDESNVALSGVTVAAYGQTTTTNQYGTFVLKNLNANKDRCVLQFTKAGFFNRSHGFIASANTVNYVRIILINNTSSQNFSSSTGGTVSLTDGSSAEFQPNSFVTSDGNAYTGTVNIAIKHLSPDDANFGFMIPGGDLLGKNMNDEDVALYTYGMLGVELTGSSGEALQLAAGSPATLTFSIAASQLSSAPASIPLWYFDETASLWKEEGTANKIGNNYVGTVAHFSWWNCDIGTYSPFIKGKVIDCEGVPVPNCVVTVNGWATTLTNQNGEYQGQVPSGLALTVQVLASNNNGIILNSQLENVSPLSNNQTFIVPDLIIPCTSKIAGTISGCNGSSSNAFIFVTWPGGINYQYCMTGSFNIFVAANVLANVKLYEGSAMQDYNVTTPNIGITTNIGNTILCSATGQPENSFYIDGNGHNNELIVIDTTQTTGYYANLIPGFLMSESGTNHSNGQSVSFSLVLSDTLPGNYTVNFFNLYIQNEFYSGYQTTNCILNEVQAVGGRIKANFSGFATDSLSNVITISGGKINVTRTQ